MRLARLSARLSSVAGILILGASGQQIYEDPRDMEGR